MSTRRLCDKDSTKQCFKVMRHEITRGSRNYYGARRLHHMVIIKTNEKPPDVGIVSDAVGYDLSGYNLYSQADEPMHVIGPFYRYEYVTGACCD